MLKFFCQSTKLVVRFGSETKTDPTLCFNRVRISKIRIKSAWVNATFPYCEVVNRLKRKVSQKLLRVIIRAVDPDSFFADPDPAVFSQCGFGSGSSCLLMRIRIQLEQIRKNYFMKSFLQLKKKKLFKRKNHGAGPNLL